MTRKVLSGILITFSSVLLVASLVGVGAIWYYKAPLTEETNVRLTNVDSELSQAGTALQDAQGELERALRIVDSSEEALQTFSEQTAVAKDLIDTVTNVLDETIKPGLATSREKIDEAQKTLDDIRASIEKINLIPFVNIAVPDDGILDSFTEVTDSLESEIVRVEEITDQASTFMNDTSYLMGGDFQETRKNIQNLQVVVDEYEGKVSAWRGQVADLQANFPGWITRSALGLTIFLLWFAFSQFGLLLHGLSAWRGRDVLAGIRKNDA